MSVPEKAVFWRDEMLPNFIIACRNSLKNEEIEAVKEWLDSKILDFLNGVRFQQGDDWKEQQRNRMIAILEATLELMKNRSWTSGKVPPNVVDTMCTSFRLFTRSHWHDILYSLIKPDPNPDKKKVAATFPMIFKSSGGGNKPPKESMLAKFELELTEEPGGEAFIAPSQLLIREMDEKFAMTFGHAAAVAADLVNNKENTKNVRVYIKPFDPDDPDLKEERLLRDYPLCGPSAGGALFLGLWSLCLETPIDPGLVTSFALTFDSHTEPDEKCHPIGGEIGKARACIERGLRTFIVSSDQCDPATGDDLDTWAESLGLTIQRADTARRATEIASGIAVELKRYYERIIAKLGETPWDNSSGSRVRVEDIAIPVRVMKEERDPDKSGLQERNRGERKDAHTASGCIDSNEWKKEPARKYVDPEIARLYEEPTMEKKRVEVKWETERRKAKRAVILGAPGGGKSFLTNCDTVHLADEGLSGFREGKALDTLPVPFHIDLTKLANVIDRVPSKPENPIGKLLNPDASESFCDWLMEKVKTEKAWLILDALDQVPLNKRDLLCEWLEKVEQHEWQCGIIITCRSANYDRRNIPWKKFAEYELSPFTPSEIRKLIDKWFGTGSVGGEKLKNLMSQSFSLAHSCRSPLVSTLVCLTHENRALESDISRGKLYKRVLRLLLERGCSLNKTEINRRLKILVKMAFPLFRNSPEVNLFSSELVSPAMIGALDKLKFRLLGIDQIEDEFIKSGILVESGLDEIDDPQYSFLHRSFLEYLVACALREEMEEGNIGLDFIDRQSWHPAWQEVIVFLSGELQDPLKLVELIELLRGKDQDDSFRHRLVLAILCVYEAWQKREMQELFVTNGSNESMINAIAEEAFAVWFGSFSIFSPFSTRGTNPEHRNIENACDHLLPALRAITVATSAVQGLPAPLERRLVSESGQERQRAVWTIEAMSISTPQVLSALQELLRTDGDGGVRLLTVSALGKVGSENDTALSALTNCISGDKDTDTRKAAIKALRYLLGYPPFPRNYAHIPTHEHKPSELRWFGGMEAEIISSLMNMLETDNYPLNRGMAAITLAEIAGQKDEVVDVLVGRLTKEYDDFTRGDIIRAICICGNSGDHVLNVLIEHLRAWPYSFHGEYPAEALGVLGRKTDEVEKALIDCLYQEKIVHYPSVEEVASQMESYGSSKEFFSKLIGEPLYPFPPYKEAGAALSALSCATMQVFEAFEHRLRQDPSDMQSIVRYGLPMMAQVDNEVQFWLIEMLKSEDENIRYAAVLATDEVGKDRNYLLKSMFESLIPSSQESDFMKPAGLCEELTQELMHSLRNDDSYLVRAYAATAIGNLLHIKPRFTELLLEQLEHDKDELVRSHILESLSKVDIPSNRVLEAMIKSLKHDSSNEVKATAAKSLSSFMSLPDELCDALCTRLHFENSDNVRFEIANCLAAVFPGVAATANELERWLSGTSTFHARWFARKHPSMALKLIERLAADVPDFTVQFEADTLAAIKLTPAIERSLIAHIKSHLNDETPGLISKLGLKSDELIGILLDVAKNDANESRRDLALRALGSMDHATDAEIDFLLAHVSNNYKAAEALAILQKRGFRIFQSAGGASVGHVQKLSDEGSPAKIKQLSNTPDETTPPAP